VSNIEGNHFGSDREGPVWVKKPFKSDDWFFEQIEHLE
jgi:hypothetical protein